MTKHPSYISALLLLWTLLFSSYLNGVNSFATVRTALCFSKKAPAMSAPVGRHVEFWRMQSGDDGNNKKTDDKDDGSAMTLLSRLDKAGQSLKPKAIKASVKATLADTKRQKWLFLFKTCLFYSLFILYRGYRGFFVILPAVFRESYRKLQNAVEEDPFEGPVKEDVNPETGKVRWRTRITVSALASVVTVSYVLGGAIRVATKFFQTITKTSNVSESFAAAANEQERNEDSIKRLASGNVNGQTPGNDEDNKRSPPRRLYP